LSNHWIGNVEAILTEQLQREQESASDSDIEEIRDDPIILFGFPRLTAEEALAAVADVRRGQ
jgi:hypothetical protein